VPCELSRRESTLLETVSNATSRGVGESPTVDLGHGLEESPRASRTASRRSAAPPATIAPPVAKGAAQRRPLSGWSRGPSGQPPRSPTTGGPTSRARSSSEEPWEARLTAGASGDGERVDAAESRNCPGERHGVRNLAIRVHDAVR
jgi:hypothetical protein